jgi:hypothetical protein
MRLLSPRIELNPDKRGHLYTDVAKPLNFHSQLQRRIRGHTYHQLKTESKLFSRDQGDVIMPPDRRGV